MDYDYKEMYLKMLRASEEAMRILIKAQQECEEMYLSGDEPESITTDKYNDENI